MTWLVFAWLMGCVPLLRTSQQDAIEIAIAGAGFVFFFLTKSVNFRAAKCLQPNRLQLSADAALLGVGCSGWCSSWWQNSWPWEPAQWPISWPCANATWFLLLGNAWCAFTRCWISTLPQRINAMCIFWTDSMTKLDHFG